ncbi:hypothetical protein ABZ845_06900 [Streptomyces sp. NPDC047022]|uniref:hypothetical protein n=1 Tax=Streptomyces sp. NPDC047022 TaxID=3155737 RepID=UPI0033D703B0
MLRPTYPTQQADAGHIPASHYLTSTTAGPAQASLTSCTCAGHRRPQSDPWRWLGPSVVIAASGAGFYGLAALLDAATHTAVALSSLGVGGVGGITIALGRK